MFLKAMIFTQSGNFTKYYVYVYGKAYKNLLYVLTFHQYLWEQQIFIKI